MKNRKTQVIISTLLIGVLLLPGFSFAFAYPTLKDNFYYFLEKAGVYPTEYTTIHSRYDTKIVCLDWFDEINLWAGSACCFCDEAEDMDCSILDNWYCAAHPFLDFTPTNLCGETFNDPLDRFTYLPTQNQCIDECTCYIQECLLP